MFECVRNYHIYYIYSIEYLRLKYYIYNLISSHYTDNRKIYTNPGRGIYLIKNTIILN